jgi:hypothetical protein
MMPPPPQGGPPNEMYPRPPQPVRKRETPWWLILIYVFGGLTALGVVGVVAFIGLIAFACGHH